VVSGPDGEAGPASALYVGRVQHRRAVPRHAFSYRLAMCLFDLSEIEEIVGRHPLWSTKPVRPVQFRRSDYLGDPTEDLGRSVRSLVESRLGPLEAGPVRVLTQARTWGWCFNPITLYYCFDLADKPQAVVASVTNTPWGECHHYVLRADGGVVDECQPKAMHVSPFLDMAQRYHFVLGTPGDHLDGQVDVVDEGNDVVLATRLELERRPLDRRAMTALLVRYPFMTWRVSAAIYLQAALLRLKGAAFHAHPHRSSACGRVHR
jgi:uncharacterized protein